MSASDFERSAELSAPAISDGALRLGERIFKAVEATRPALGCNTNLGIVLMCAPLTQAAIDRPDAALRAGTEAALRETGIVDADWVFRAISLAAPGGLGRV